MWLRGIYHDEIGDVHGGIEVVHARFSDPGLISNEGSVWVLADEAVVNHSATQELLRRFDPQNLAMTALAGGEAVKSHQNWLDVMAFGYRRFARPPQKLIAIGGGAILNLGTFVAGCFDPAAPDFATPPYKSYVRGTIPELIVVPTTMLAMADVAFGSKGNLNGETQKHAYKIYRDPEQIFLDPAYLESLPAGEMKRGLSECLKQALLQTRGPHPDIRTRLKNRGAEDRAAAIWDARLYKWPPDLDAVCALIKMEKPSPEACFWTACNTMYAKAAVIGLDPSEQGWTSIILNYGHLHAHALEMASGFAIHHGDSGFIGMLVDLKMAGDEKLYRRILDLYPHMPAASNRALFEVDEAALRYAYRIEPKRFFRMPDGNFKVLWVPRAGLYAGNPDPRAPDPMRPVGLDKIIAAWREVMTDADRTLQKSHSNFPGWLTGLAYAS